MSSAGPIVVIGSLNMDLVVKTPRIPVEGETLLGGSFVTIPGGKGANQAVAAARLADLGTKVHIIGRVGDDDFGRQLLSGLAENGVDATNVTVTKGVASGVAVILVDAAGENSIVVAPGANASLSPADIDAAEALIASASIVILQLEIPLETVAHAIGICQRLKVRTILDPAPAPAAGLPTAMFGVDVLSPNQIEAETLLAAISSEPAMRSRGGDSKQLAMELLACGARGVALKLGHRGSVAVDRDGLVRSVPAFKVNVVDSTAAGDAFTGALAVGHCEGMSLLESARFANAAGALCCVTFGAQPALPTRDAVERLMELHGAG